MDINAHREYLATVRSEIANCASRNFEIDAQLEKLAREKASNADALAGWRQLESMVAALVGEDLPAVIERETPSIVHPSPAHNTDVLYGVPGEQTAHADVAESILRSTGKPMRVGEIIEEMRIARHPLPTEDTRAFGAVYSALKRRPAMFVKLDRGMWDLAERARASKREKRDGDVHPSRPRLAIEALRQLGGLAAASRVLDKMNEMGHHVHHDRKRAINIIWNALDRSPFARHSDGHWELVANPDLDEGA